MNLGNIILEKKYKYLFGPVNSRRLGRSLGIDTVPYKTCSMDCIYCESGKTTDLTLLRREFFPVEEIEAELTEFFSSCPEVDFVTFSGAGEPLLYTGIGAIVRFLKKNYPQYKIALLTNSMLLTKKEVFNDVLGVDLIVPSLDAAIEGVFEKINRPLDSSIGCGSIIEALKNFKDESEALFFLEILFIKGVNDSLDSIEALREAVVYINPDKVQLNTLDRPGTEKDISPLSFDELEDISSLFQNCGVLVEVVARVFNETSARKAGKTLSKVLEGQICALLKRRPSTLDDIATTLGITHLSAEFLTATLLKSGNISEEMRGNIKFYKKH